MDRDSFSILFSFLEDDIYFLYYCSTNNIKVNGKYVDFSNDKIDWNHVSSLDLSVTMMRDFKNYLNWDIISEVNKENIDIIREFKDEIQWDVICGSMRFHDDDIFSRDNYAFCKEFSEYLLWSRMSRWNNMDEMFVHLFSDKVCWNTISSCIGLSPFLLETYRDKINWTNINNNRAVDRDFANRFNPNIENENKEDEGEDIVMNDIDISNVDMTEVEMRDIELGESIGISVSRNNQNDVIINFIDDLINNDILYDPEDDYDNVD